jgi:hypothetical protein
MSEPIAPPDNPTSAVLIRMEAPGRSDVFAFLICFPRDDRYDTGRTGVQLTITSRPIRPHETLSSELDVAKGYATHIIDELLKKSRVDLLDRTNWPSVVASITHMIEEFEERRRAARPTLQ